MNKFLTEQQRQELLEAHRVEDKLRYGDRIKTLLLLDAGWRLTKISEALLLDEKTIRNYRKLYEEGGIDRLCNDDYKGGSSFLVAEQIEDLKEHLQSKLYSTALEIVQYVEQEYGISYSLSGMTDLLHRIGFVYKKTKLVPGKSDPEKQEEFLSELETIKNQKSEKDKIYYLDGVHPQHNTMSGNGWILKGEDYELKTNTGRKRINLNGALDSDTLEVIIREDNTINAESTINLFQMLEKQNPKAEVIYAIADNARYYKNKLVQKYLESSRICLLFLPAYSPNLNLIERLWKFFKKKILANQYYEKFTEFRQACLSFFDKENQEGVKPELNTLLTQNFNIIGKTSP